MSTLNVFSKLDIAQLLVFDIGPFHSKVGCYIPPHYEGPSDTHLLFEARVQAIKFDTQEFENLVKKISPKLKNINAIYVMGSQASTFKTLLQNTFLGISIVEIDEIDSMIFGFHKLLECIPEEVFIVHPSIRFLRFDHDSIYPHLLITVDDEILIIKVDSPCSYGVVYRSALGGSTFLTLGVLNNSEKSLEGLLEQLNNDDDFTENDVENNGTFQPFLNHFKAIQRGQFYKLSENDKIKGILWTLNCHMAQVISLIASKHSINKVFFGKLFTGKNENCVRSFSAALNYWSEGKVQPIFLRHENFLGVLHPLFDFNSSSAKVSSWYENYAVSSGCFPEERINFENIPVLQLAFDRSPVLLAPCPLFKNISSYVSETFPLEEETETRSYWLEYYKHAVIDHIDKLTLQTENNDERHALKCFNNSFLHKYEYMTKSVNAFGKLTFQKLYETLHDLKREYHFYDSFKKIKNEECEVALKALDKQLGYLDKLSYSERHLDLILSIMAGNLFDRGAKEYLNLLKDEIDFFKAKSKIKSRPWGVDNVDEWLERMENGQPHKCAAIFVDNCGVDLILGIIPFARELIKRKTKVILCSNLYPIVNDVTHKELIIIMKQVAERCPIINEAINNSNLICVDNGHRGPALDLRYLSKELADLMPCVDLVIFEGMGRALFTNLNVQLTCETLKIALLKDVWVAKRVGGQLFEGLLKYDRFK